MNQTFPPPLVVGARVWSEGYSSHGPVNGPKIDIAPHQSGTITAVQRPYSTIDDLLYTIRWTNGQTSKHYTKELFCTGRFQSRLEFEAAISLEGEVHLTLGPNGGFRSVRVALTYDGLQQTTELLSRELWLTCIESLVNKSGCKVLTTKLSRKA